MIELVYELLKWILLIIICVAACVTIVSIGILIINIIISIPILINEGIRCLIYKLKKK